MKKHYILVPGFAVFLFALLWADLAGAQTNNMPQFTPYTPIQMYNWDDANYESWQYINPAVGGLYNLRFRLMKPVGWASSPPTQRYPLIVFFHGSGEVASGDPDLQNNEHQFIHGGQTHMNAVLSGKFPGFLLYPQMRRTGENCGVNGDYSNAACNANNWNPDWREAVKYVIDKLIADYRVDPDRIYVHGLSGGGEATLQFIADYPEYVAAAHPMSAAGSQFHAGTTKNYFIHVPLWTAQGALDTGPTPEEGNAQVIDIRNAGGSIRYSYHPNLGHGVWNTQYAHPEFFSWFLSHHKKNPHVYYEEPLACPGETVNVRVGYSKTRWVNGARNTPNRYRIINYQWAKGAPSEANLVASGANQNEIVVHSNPNLATNANCTPGVYYARFQRANYGWSEWSDPIVITDTRGPSPSPEISNGGKSTTLPSLDGGAEVVLTGSLDKYAYQWQRDGVNISGATLYKYAASVAGSYTLRTREPAASPYQFETVPKEFRAPGIGCFSNPSAPIVVTTSNGLTVPAPPSNFFATSNDPAGAVVSWHDRSDNEEAFELYRSTVSGSGYEMVAYLPATNGQNPYTFNDTGLMPNTTYYYRMRAVNANGGSAYTAVASVKTAQDVTPPTPPVLSIPGTQRNMILLQWTGATDNAGIAGYDIYQNGVLIASVGADAFYYEARNLVAQSTYYFTVRTRDHAGNVSPPSNQMVGVARNSGLMYKYYHHDGLSSTGDIANAKLEKIGFVTSFSTSARTRTDNYAFVYEGFINLPSNGQYRFAIQSDEGSRMWINNQLVVNNDGTHPSTKVTSDPITLSSGWTPIRVAYFENINSEALTVRWIRPGQSEQNIPSSALSESAGSQTSITTPNNFTANPVLYNSVKLNWSDRSNNESGFEIHRLESPNGSGTYKVIHVTPNNTTTWTDTDVKPSTRYYYRIRAISATGQSNMVNLSGTYITTPAAPTPPPAPASVVPTPEAPTTVALTWANVADETGYELQKSSDPNTGFTTLATTTADNTAFVDNSATGNSTLYYRVRSIGLGGATSDWSPVAPCQTLNRAPVFTPIPDQTVVQSSGVPQYIDIKVSDPDSDPITFNFINLPGTYQFESNGYGQGRLSLTNVPPGQHSVTVEASDGVVTVSDVFVLTASANQAPVINTLSINGGPALPFTTMQNQSTEAGRTLRLEFKVADPNGNGQLTSGLPPVLILPPGLNFANAVWTATGTTVRTYVLSFTPTIEQTGLYEDITVRFRDNQGGITQIVFSLVVNSFDPEFSIFINFAWNSSHYEGLPWNNTGPRSDSPMTNLIDENGDIVKHVTFTPAVANWADHSNITLPATENAVFTKNVRESAFRSNSYFGVGINMTFKGLNPALRYRVKPYAASPAPTSNQRFTITGSTSQVIDYNAGQNTSYLPSTGLISPNSNGEINVNLKTPDGNSPGPNGYMYMNALVLEAVYFEEAPPPAPSNVALSSIAYNEVTVTWQDNSFNENTFKIYRATNPDGPYQLVGSVANNIRTFNNTNTSGRTTYYYKVSAENQYGESPMSAYAFITTPNGAPAVTNPGTVIVTAGQALQKNISATDPEGDAMTFSVAGLPEFAILNDNGNGTGSINFAPGLDDVGVYQLTLSVVDPYSGSSDAQFSLIVIDPDASQTIYINLTGSSAANEDTPWNNIAYGSVGTTSGTATPLLNTAGQTHGGIYRGGSWVGGSDDVGVSTGNNSGAVPDNALKSGWITSQTGFNSTITINGLSNTMRYNITIIGSRDEFWFADEIYRLSTAASAGTGGIGTSGSERTLNTRKNRDNVVRYYGVQPSSSTIAFQVRKSEVVENYGVEDNGVGATIRHRDAVVSAIIIEGYSTSIVRRPTNLVAKPVSTSSIQLTWWDKSANETGFEIQRATDPEGPFSLVATVGANVESWTDTGRPKNTAYAYRVRAIRSGNSPSEWSTIAMASTYDQMVLVNVNGQSLLQGAPWNNTYQETGAINTEAGFKWYDFTNTAGQGTPIDLEVSNYTGGGARADRGYAMGYTSDNPALIYPYNVMMSSYLYNAASGSDWRLRQLDPNAAYDFVFFGTEWEGNGYQGASRARWGEKVVTDFVVGPDVISVFNPKNAFERAYFYGVRPDADSTINFEVNAHMSATEQITSAFFNAFELRWYTPVEYQFDKVAPSVPQNLAVVGVGVDSVRLSWTASTDNVHVAGYEVFQDDVYVMTVPSNVATVTGLEPATTYSFKVRAKDGKGLLSGFSNSVNATTIGTDITTYYAKANGEITELETWSSTPDGNGSSPTEFNNHNLHFILNRNASVSEPMDLTGINTKLIVTNGATLTLDDAVIGEIDLEDDAQLVINGNVTPQLGELSPTSTVVYNSNITVDPATYGHLSLGGSGSTKTLSAGTYEVTGNLTLGGGVTLAGSVENNTIINVAGNVIFSGAVTFPQEDQRFSINLSSGGDQELDLAGVSTVSLHELNVLNGSKVKVKNTSATKTFVVGTATGGGVVIEEDGVLDLGRTNLTVSSDGAINPNGETGVFRVSKSVFTIASQGAQTSHLRFEAGADTLKALHLNGHTSASVEVETRVYVQDVLDVQAGTLNSGDNVSLVSTKNYTARIGPVGTGGNISGGVEFQRYLDQKRVYRYMATPVSGTHISDWQSYMDITGPFNGASPGSGGRPSLYYYDEPEGGWIAYPPSNGDASATFELGRGYSIYQYLNDTLKLQITGPVHVGSYPYNDITPPDGPNTGWNLLGNPYASPIQWNNVLWQGNGQMQDLSGTVYIRENTSAGGGFKVWNSESGGDPEEFDGTIAQGQAFWVQSTGPNPTLTITESDKKNVNDAAFFRARGPENQLMITLTKGDVTDKAFVHFSPESTDGIEGRFDALKRPNEYFNLSTRAGSNDLSINSLSLEFCQRSIPLNIGNVSAGTYKLSINELGAFDFGAEVVLVDRLTSKEYVVNDGFEYSFNITSDPASYGASRFELNVKKIPVDLNTTFYLSTNSHCYGDETPFVSIPNSQKGVLYHVMSFNDTLQTLVGNGGNVQGTLKVAELRNMTHDLRIVARNVGCEPVTLERTESIYVVNKPVLSLVDGVLTTGLVEGEVQWYKDGELIPNATSLTYMPLESGQYSVELRTQTCDVWSDGFDYLVTGLEDPFGGENAVQVYPNPVEDILTVMLRKVPQGANGNAYIAIHNAMGQAVVQKYIPARVGPNDVNVEGLAAGLYTITVHLPDGVVQKRFIKK